MNRNTLLVIGVAIVGIFLFLNPLKYITNRGGVERRPAVPPERLSALVSWAGQNARIPEDYIVGAFAKHDIVFLGELPKLRPNVQLVSLLIPRLYAAGVRSLGIEYALSDDQKDIDALVTAPAWDEAKARAITFDWVVTWGFQEYIDIYKAAWNINHSRPAGAPPFRVIGLSVRQNWQYLKTAQDARNPEVVAKLFANGVPDAHMAQVIMSDLVRPGEKALVYCSAEHAFTRYESPDYEKSAKEMKLSETRRAGVIVSQAIGPRAFTILLHGPWPDPGSRTGLGWAADGAIDALIDALPLDKRLAGFDTAGTPLGALPITTGGYRGSGKTPLTLADVTDGYVIQGPLSEYGTVTPIKDFVRPEDAAAALERFPGPKPPSLTAAQANAAIADDATALGKLLALFR